jgi:hypothetical protein
MRAWIRSFLAHRRAAKKRDGSRKRIGEQVERSTRRARQAKSRAVKARRRAQERKP